MLIRLLGVVGALGMWMWIIVLFKHNPFDFNDGYVLLFYFFGIVSILMSFLFKCGGWGINHYAIRGGRI